MPALALIERYYAAFNAGDRPAMLACLTMDVVHDINQGERQAGKAAFAAFLDHMDTCYAEKLADITVMVTPDGQRAAAECTVHGHMASPKRRGSAMFCLPELSLPSRTDRFPGSPFITICLTGRGRSLRPDRAALIPRGQSHFRQWRV